VNILVESVVDAIWFNQGMKKYDKINQTTKNIDNKDKNLI
jgi:hypothetical protein